MNKIVFYSIILFAIILFIRGLQVGNQLKEKQTQLQECLELCKKN